MAYSWKIGKSSGKYCRRGTSTVSYILKKGIHSLTATVPTLLLMLLLCLFYSRIHVYECECLSMWLCVEFSLVDFGMWRTQMCVLCDFWACIAHIYMYRWHVCILFPWYTNTFIPSTKTTTTTRRTVRLSDHIKFTSWSIHIVTLIGEL